MFKSLVNWSFRLWLCRWIIKEAMLNLLKRVLAMKMAFYIVVIIAFAAFGGTVGIAWRAGSLSLPVLVVLLVIAVVVWISSGHTYRSSNAQRHD